MDKYAFRCVDNSVALTLIRGAYDPAPTPETGRHHISFAIVPAASGEEPVRESLAYRHPFTVLSGRAGGRTRPADALAATDLVSADLASADLMSEGSLLALEEGSVVLSAIKRPEAGGKRLLIRVYETQGKASRAVFRLGFKVRAAYLTDALETKRMGEAVLKEGTLSFEVPPYGVQAVMLELG
jgi:alpha-mannosidase